MKTTFKNHFERTPARVTARAGGTLLTVMILTATLTVLLGTLAAASLQRVHSLRVESEQMRAMAIAEAGLNLAFNALAADHTLAHANNPILINPEFGGGHYTVSATSPMTNVVLLRSTGTYRQREVEVIATVALHPPEAEDSSNDFSAGLPGPFGAVALFAGGNLTMSGGIQVHMQGFSAHANGTVNLSGFPTLYADHLSTHNNIILSGNPQLHLGQGSGRLHADGPISLRGNIQAAEITSSASINGDWGTMTPAVNMAPSVTWPNWFSPMPPVQIGPVATVPPMSLPTLDVDAYRDAAIAHTYFYQGNQNITRSWLTADILERTGVNVNNNETVVEPSGGILFIDGDVTVGQDMVINGMIMATGNITIGGGSTFSNPTPFPALVSVDGNITIGGGASGPTVNGWIYAMNGNVAAGGGASGLSGIVAAHNLSITAGYTLGNTDSESSFTSPGQPGGPGGETPGDEHGNSITLLSWIR